MIVAVSLDLGTTSIKAGLVSADGELIGLVVRPAPPIVVEAGRYESDAIAYAEVAEAVLAECLARTSARPPLGLCSQRSSFLLWERASGRPVTPLISWQDDRGKSSCRTLRENEGRINALTGLPLTPYYLGPKLSVLLDAHPDWRARLQSGEWMLGTLDTFLIWRWTDGRHHMMDASMAARTLLMDIQRVQWSDELCALFRVDAATLPEIVPSSGLDILLGNGLHLQASVGDQSAALLHAIRPGQKTALVNLGTGGFVAALVSPEDEVLSGYLRTLVCVDGKGRKQVACEGTLNSIASALAPYPAEYSLPEELARDEVFCLAEPSGLGAPYFRSDLGICFSESVEQLAPQRIAVLLQEAIIFRVARIFEELQRKQKLEIAILAGGLANLPCIQQGIAALVPAAYHQTQSEAGLLGVAGMVAGKDLKDNAGVEKIFQNQDVMRIRAKYSGWKSWLDGLLRHDPPKS